MNPELIRLIESNEIQIHGDVEYFAELVAAAEREAAMKDAERYRHAMREAMYLLDQPEPRPHAAFSELLLALNPAIDNSKKSAIRARGEK